MINETKNIDKKIIDYYVNNCQTLNQVGKLFNVSSYYVYQCLKKHDIPRRRNHETRKANYSLNENYFHIIDNESKAYWLGFLYADGCNTGQNALSLYLSSVDILHIKKFLRDLECNIHLSLKDNSKIRLIKGWSNAKDSIGFQIHNKIMLNDLNNLGCIPNKSLVLKFPNEKQVPKHLVRHFIRGYFDGDGCLSFSIDKRNKTVYKKPKYEINIVGTLNFLTELDIHCQENNVIGKISKCKRIYQYRIYGNQNCKNFLNFIYNESNIYLTRKYNKYFEFNEMNQLFN